MKIRIGGNIHTKHKEERNPSTKTKIMQTKYNYCKTRKIISVPL
jgi:hypothetical protein